MFPPTGLHSGLKQCGCGKFGCRWSTGTCPNYFERERDGAHAVEMRTSEKWRAGVSVCTAALSRSPDSCKISKASWNGRVGSLDNCSLYYHLFGSLFGSRLDRRRDKALHETADTMVQGQIKWDNRREGMVGGWKRESSLELVVTKVGVWNVQAIANLGSGAMSGTS